LTGRDHASAVARPAERLREGITWFSLDRATARSSPAVSSRSLLAAIDSNVPVLEVSSFGDQMSRVLYEERRNAQVAFAVALLALALGAVGVHGVIALVTACRTREIGIRVAAGSGGGTSGGVSAYNRLTPSLEATSPCCRIASPSS
jgi:hypothetical protein